MDKRIKVLVVDDHDLIREGLNRIISFEEDLIIIDEFSNGEDALNNIEFNLPDVVLLDINMPKKNGIETLETIKNKYKDIKVVMLTVENDKKTIMEAIKIGADGYILKESAGAEIVNAIRDVYIDEKYIDKTLIKEMFFQFKINENNSKVENKIFNKLNKREVVILYEISRGLKNKEIAEKLYLSEKTIKNYITNIFKKIKVDDRVQATIFAIRNNIEDYYKNF